MSTTIPDPESTPLVSVEDSATMLGISRSSAYAAARCGEIPSIRIGRRVMIPTAGLRRMLQLPERIDAA